MKSIVFIVGLLLVSCGKEEAKTQPKAAAAPKAVSEKKEPPPVPQGKLPVMDPEKAKFIAAPSTPKDPEVKKAEEPAVEAQKVEQPAGEAKK
jgi:hypothetical protein